MYWFPRLRVDDYEEGVFLDLKFHDIPNTVAGAARAVVRMGVDMFNLHAAGGPEMMRAAREAAAEEAERLGLDPPLILGVTILTSLSDEDLRGIYGAELSARRLVERMALLAKEAGLDGVVASPGEIGIVKGACGCLLYTSPSPRDLSTARMPSSA